MAKKTNNLGLTKPENAEFYAVNVANDNMDKIDAKISEIDVTGKISQNPTEGTIVERTSGGEVLARMPKNIDNFSINNTGSISTSATSDLGIPKACNNLPGSTLNVGTGNYNNIILNLAALLRHRHNAVLDHPNKSVTKEKLSDDVIAWITTLVGSGEIADGTITKSKLAQDIIEWITSLVASGGDLESVWNAINNKVDKTQYASVSQAGVIKPLSSSGINRSGIVIGSDGTAYINTNGEYGTARTGDGKIVISPADEIDIDERIQKYRPITPATLEYAVLSIVGNSLWGNYYTISNMTSVDRHDIVEIPNISAGALFYIHNDTENDYKDFWHNDDVKYELNKTIYSKEYALCTITSKLINNAPDLFVNGKILVIAKGYSYQSVIESAFEKMGSASLSGVDTDKDLYYAVCEDGANTAEKTATVVSGQFELKNGVAINVKFTKGINAVKSTLNINGTGAKNITYNGVDGLDCLDYGSPLCMDGIVNFVYDKDRDQYTAVQLDNNDTANFTVYEVTQLKTKVTDLESRLTALEQKAITAE